MSGVGGNSSEFVEIGSCVSWLVSGDSTRTFVITNAAFSNGALLGLCTSFISWGVLESSEMFVELMMNYRYERQFYVLLSDYLKPLEVLKLIKNHLHP